MCAGWWALKKKDRQCENVRQNNRKESFTIFSDQWSRANRSRPNHIAGSVGCDIYHHWVD